MRLLAITAVIAGAIQFVVGTPIKPPSYIFHTVLLTHPADDAMGCASRFAEFRQLLKEKAVRHDIYEETEQPSDCMVELGLGDSSDSKKLDSAANIQKICLGSPPPPGANQDACRVLIGSSAPGSLSSNS